MSTGIAFWFKPLQVLLQCRLNGAEFGHQRYRRVIVSVSLQPEDDATQFAHGLAHLLRDSLDTVRPWCD